MKNSFLISLIAFLFLNLQLVAQTNETKNLMSDNFSLQAALEVFKNSDSPEDFEIKLNEEGSHVSNLDLNNDGLSLIHI